MPVFPSPGKRSCDGRTGRTPIFQPPRRQQPRGFATIDETARYGEMMPLHWHSNDVESLYVLKGEPSINPERLPCRPARPGVYAHVARGVVHGFRIERASARDLHLTLPPEGGRHEDARPPSQADTRASHAPFS